jgi:hypothetical protein
VGVAEDVLATDCDRPELAPKLIELAEELESDGARARAGLRELSRLRRLNRPVAVACVAFGLVGQSSRRP